MSPFPELCVQLHINQCTRDGAVAKALLDLEEIRASLIVVERMSMTEGMESIAAAFPSELGNPILKDLGQGSFIDM